MVHRLSRVLESQGDCPDATFPNQPRPSIRCHARDPTAPLPKAQSRALAPASNAATPYTAPPAAETPPCAAWGAEIRRMRLGVGRKAYNPDLSLTFFAGPIPPRTEKRPSCMPCRVKDTSRFDAGKNLHPPSVKHPTAFASSRGEKWSYVCESWVIRSFDALTDMYKRISWNLEGKFTQTNKQTSKQAGRKAGSHSRPDQTADNRQTAIQPPSQPKRQAGRRAGRRTDKHPDSQTRTDAQTRRDIQRHFHGSAHFPPNKKT